MQEELFESQAISERMVSETLIVDVDGFEGPLDLLLNLSRTQKLTYVKFQSWT